MAAIVLWVGRPCASCEAAERVWREVAGALGLQLDVRDVDLGEATREQTSALPLLCVDGRAVVVGVPDREAARALLEDAVRGGPAGPRMP